MSTASATSPTHTNGNGNGSVKISGPVFAVLVGPLVLAAFIGVTAWGWGLQTTNNAQDVSLRDHEIRLNQCEKAIEKIDAKLDRILEKLGG
jgi:hypothetical protein